MKRFIFYVYILTNKNKTVLYTGVTNDLARRCFEHLCKRNKGFTSRYNVNRLIYYEVFKYINEAITWEKQIKRYTRKRKELLIDSFNPDCKELYSNGIILRP